MAQGKQITWTPKAFDLLLDLTAYHADHIGQVKANEFLQELVAYIEKKLSLWPESCALCRNLKLRNTGHRCCNYLKKYVVVYRIENGDVIIIGVINMKRHPRAFEDLI